MLALRLGLDTTGFTFPDIARWAGADPRSPAAEIVAATGERVLSAAAKAFTSWDGDVGNPARLVSGPRLAARDRPERAAVNRLPYGEAVRMLSHADRFFAGQVQGSWVPGYLVSRGFSAAVQERWGAGYAPAGWTALTDHLRGLGYDDQAIEECGLAKRSAQGRVIDVFRDRLMFPVHSVSGSVIGFVGRARPGAGKDTPKYLNSRASPLYSKGRVLFGLNESRDALASGARPVIVEGPLDALAVTSAGDGRYVGLAPCGTALTADHVALLSKAANLAETGLRVGFDGDKAGQAAAVRAYALVRDVVEQPLLVDFPEGQDPAALVCLRGAGALVDVLDSSVRPLADVVVDAVVAKYGHWLEFIEGKFNALNAVAPLIAQMPACEVGRQVVRVAGQLSLTYVEVTTAVTEALECMAPAPEARAERRGPDPPQLERGQPAPSRRAERPSPGSSKSVSTRRDNGRRRSGTARATGRAGALRSGGDAWASCRQAASPRPSLHLRSPGRGR
jgi:DNA primase